MFGRILGQIDCGPFTIAVGNRVVLSALITLLLGVMIVARWPYSSVYTLGIFLGVDLLFIGSAWMGVGLALKNKKD